ncbi:hypothetical protein PV08_03013 [Exophiala spinifera]|uniref:nitrilase n=1 Tax=Exophiala spinifera TaxID=91928 RepID=A0A0D2C550_9EURO|nr:uncharacterized protein PV08_03013 [Exophiala spinifera]KIW18724.1 hypothetical protein PV08_03013 [Exophiala spinifera]
MDQEQAQSIRVAVTQCEPAWLDLQSSVQKTCDLIKEAQEHGAQLVAFPEVWIPGYPAWIWSRPADPELHVKYMKNSLVLESPEMKQIQAASAEHGISVSLGFSERSGNSLFIAQVTIDCQGKIVLHRRKMKATHMERTIFADACATSLKSVVQLPFARVGALSCWEHSLPLLKYNTHLQNEQIHVGAWPPLFSGSDKGQLWSMSREGCRTLSQAYAIEAGSFVLHTTAVLSRKGIDLMRTESGIVMHTPGGGSSAIIGPDGRILSADLPEEEEGIIYADIDLDEVLKVKGFLDTCGHYSRPDLLWLGANTDPRPLKRDV